MRKILVFIFWLIASYSQAQTGFFSSLLHPATDTDYQAYIDKLDELGYAKPPIEIQLAQNKFVVDLKAAGLWTRMKTGYFFHAGDINTGRINLKSPSTYAMTISGSSATTPIQIQGVGVRSGGGGYYNQPFKSNEYAGIHTDLTTIQYMPNEPFASEYAQNAYSSGMDVTLASGTDNYIGLNPFHTAGAPGQGVRAHATTTYTFNNTSHHGLYVNTYDGTNSVIYKDGTKTSNAATPVVPNNSINRFIFATNNDGTATTQYNRLISADFLFDRFNDTDESTFRGIWTTFANSINLNFQYVSEYASHCWFTRNKSAYDPIGNKSWIGQCHSDAFNVNAYSQYIFEIDNDTNTLSKFKLGTVTEQDDHNEPSILVRSSDSKLFCVYTEHGGSVLRWRISTNALDASAWGAEQTLDAAGGGTHVYTYPSAFEASNGDIYVFFRDQVGSPVITQRGWSYVKSTDGGATFSGYARITGVTYSTLAQDPNDKDIIHFVVSWHPDDAVITDNHILHGYWDCSGNTFHKSDGTNITASIPVTQAHMTIISTSLAASNEDCWIEDIIIDSSGKPRILFNKIPDMPTASIKDEYYSEWTGSAWTTPYLLHREATHHMETTLNDATITQPWYAPLGSFDRADPDRIFSSIETAGHFGNKCEIWELRRVSHNSFTRVQRTFDSSNDQWRPFTIESPTNNVFWLDKLYYDDYLNTYFQVLKLRTFQD